MENRKARFDFDFLEEIVAGIMLRGGEVSAIRSGRGALQGSHVVVSNGRVLLRGMHIPMPAHCANAPWEPYRDRELLVTSKERSYIARRIGERGLTCVPVKTFFSEKGVFKITLAIARGRNHGDKRELIKSRDLERDSRRELKEAGR